jgi:hypothetical protein
MKLYRSKAIRLVLLISLMAGLTMLAGRIQADSGSCGGLTVTLPFTDVQGNPFFCLIAQAYVSGLAAGTSATTYSPASIVTREQMAAFITRTMDQSLKRGSPRAALGEWWINKSPVFNTATSTGFHNPRFLACDGLSVWASNTEGNSISRIDIQTSQLICTLNGVPSPEQMVLVGGYVFVTSYQTPGKIYYESIKSTANGTMDILAEDIGANPTGITYDGENLWTANSGTGPGTGSLSRRSLVNLFTGSSTYATGFSQPVGVLYDGVNLWVTDAGDTSLKRVDMTSGAVLQTIPLSGVVQHPVFDGANLWIPCTDRVFVVRGGVGQVGTVLAELTGNGLNGAFQAAFDGERICVTNASARSVSLWKATDLSPLGSINILRSNSPYNPRGVCSDGTIFFIGLRETSGGSGLIVRL